MSVKKLQELQTTGADQSIGDILRSTHDLTAEQVQSVLEYQKINNVRFGEAAVALGVLKRDQVIWALSQQFNYPYPAKTEDQALSRDLITAHSPFSEDAEFFRDIRSQLTSSVFTESAPSTLAVTSTAIGDGKSYFAANIAIVFSQLGVRTLLIDADMRTPTQHKLFNVESNAGLSSILSGRTEPNVIRPIQALSNLYLLPVGVTPPNPLELLERPLFGLLIKELSSKFDYIVVDTPALAHGADGLIVASKADATVCIARSGETKKDELKKMIARLESTPTRFAGVIMNQR